jgi:hypothetical protein
VTERISIGS